jgi:hypothetical protein
VPSKLRLNESMEGGHLLIKNKADVQYAIWEL